MRNLIEFLTQNGYGYPISAKLLTNPSDKDFFRIFQFLYHKIDPNFAFASIGTAADRRTHAGRANSVKASDTMVEQIPELMKALGYPIKINRSAVISCGSASNWPKMLGVIQFLLEVVTLQETVDVTQHIFGGAAAAAAGGFEEDVQAAAEHNEIMFSYLYQAYTAFLSGEDELKDELDAEMMESYQNKAQQLEAELQNATADGERMRRELAELTEGPSELEALRARKAEFVGDLAKFKLLVSNLQAHTAKLDGKLARARGQVELKTEERDAALGERARLEHLRDNQELKPADVEEMTTARQQLDSRMAAVRARKEELDNRAWKCEIALAKKTEQAEELAASFNRTAEELHIIPAGAQLADVVDFELRLNPKRNEPGQDFFLSDLPGAVRPALQALQSRVGVKVRSLQETTLQAHETAKKATEAMQDCQARNATLAHTLSAREEQYQAAKAQVEHELGEEQRSLDSIREEVLQLRQRLAVGQQERARAIEAAEMEVVALNEELEQERSSVTQDAYFIVRLITEQKTRVQESIAHLRGVIDDAKRC